VNQLYFPLSSALTCLLCNRQTNDSSRLRSSLSAGVEDAVCPGIRAQENPAGATCTQTNNISCISTLFLHQVSCLCAAPESRPWVSTFVSAVSRSDAEVPRARPLQRLVGQLFCHAGPTEWFLPFCGIARVQKKEKTEETVQSFGKRNSILMSLWCCPEERVDSLVTGQPNQGIACNHTMDV